MAKSLWLPYAWFNDDGTKRIVRAQTKVDERNDLGKVVGPSAAIGFGHIYMSDCSFALTLLMLHKHLESHSFGLNNCLRPQNTL